MTKVGPTRDYPVVVQPYGWDEPDNPVPYEGIFTVILNLTVWIAFVPDLGGAASRWDATALPEDLDDVTTPEQGRLSVALFSSYVVTPNDALAGSHERFTLPPDPLELDDDPAGSGGVVWYVGDAEFAGFQRELAELGETYGGLHHGRPVSQLRDGYAVVRFLEREVVRRDLLRAYDAHLLAVDT